VKPIYGYKKFSSGGQWKFERSTKPLSDAPGNTRLLAHLKSAGNLEEKYEWSEGRPVKLWRPMDFEYAKSWVKGTRQLLNCERQTVFSILELAESDRTIWLSFE
jgi:hypothetical protein